MTKEQLQEELTKIRQSHADWVASDEARRKELSRMLGAPHKKRGMYDNYSDAEVITYTWPQIYFQIGKISAAITFYNLEGNVSELEVLTNQMREDLDKFFVEKTI